MAQIIFTGKRPEDSAWATLVPGLAQAASLAFAEKKRQDQLKIEAEERERKREREDWTFETEQQRREEEKEDRVAETQSKTHEIQKALAEEQAERDVDEAYERAGTVQKGLLEDYLKPTELKMPGAVSMEREVAPGVTLDRQQVGTEEAVDIGDSAKSMEALNALMESAPGAREFAERLQGDVTIPGVEKYGVEDETLGRGELAARAYDDRQRAAAARAREKGEGPIVFPDDESVPPFFRGRTFRPGEDGYEMAEEVAPEYAKSLFASKKAGSLKQAYDSKSGRKVFVTDSEIQSGGGRYQPISAAPDDAPDKENRFLRGAAWDIVENARDEWLAGNRKNMDLTDAERKRFLASLPVEILGPAQGVADLDLDPAKAGRGVEMRSAIIQTAKILNPNFTQHGFEFKRDWAKGKPATARRAVNDAIADVGRAFKLSEEFRRTGMPWINKGYVWFLEQVGSPEEKALRTRLKTLATEFSKAQNNGMAAKQEEIEEAYRRYMTSATPEELEAILREDLHSTVNRIVTLENDYERFVGEPVPTPTLNKQTIEKAREAGYYDIFVDAGAVLTEGGGGGAPGDEPIPEIGAVGQTITRNGKTYVWDEVEGGFTPQE